MDQYADIYYVDTRNAVTDHRTGTSASAVPFRPMVPGQSVGSRIAVGQPGFGAQPMIYATPVAGASLLGRLTTGQLVEMVAEIFAALQSLPAAPVATQDPTTDIGNSILYQTALAQHAKRDEQVRTLGHLVARLIG